MDLGFFCLMLSGFGTAADTPLISAAGVTVIMNYCTSRQDPYYCSLTDGVLLRMRAAPIPTEIPVRLGKIDVTSIELSGATLAWNRERSTRPQQLIPSDNSASEFVLWFDADWEVRSGEGRTLVVAGTAAIEWPGKSVFVDIPALDLGELSSLEVPAVGVRVDSVSEGEWLSITVMGQIDRVFKLSFPDPGDPVEWSGDPHGEINVGGDPLQFKRPADWSRRLCITPVGRRERAPFAVNIKLTE